MIDLSQSIDARIRYAIAHRRLIEISYKGGRRLAEPHDYGAQHQVDRLLIYQRRGPARPGQSPVGWRLLDVMRIEVLVVLDEQFDGTRGGRYLDHHEWDVIYARVR